MSIVIKPIKLTRSIMRYSWNDIRDTEPTYSYYNADEINIKRYGRMQEEGIPDTKHYIIWFEAPVVGKKRPVSVHLYFDGNGVLTSIDGKMKDEELLDHYNKALTTLIAKGWVEA